MSNTKSESVDKYIYEPLLWSLIPALVPTALGKILGPHLPEFAIDIPFAGPIAVVVGLVLGIGWLLVSLNIGTEIAARRRGLSRDEYWTQHKSAKEARRVRRSRRKVENAVATLRKEVEDGEYSGEVDVTGDEITVNTIPNSLEEQS